MKIVKGFRDITPFGKNPTETSSYWNYIVKNLKDTMDIYNFSEIITPVLEHTSTFKTGIGSDTDIVSKEMYEFSLRNQEKEDVSYCLRPEGTAPIVRSYIENSLYKLKKINKLFYLGPMYRYERSQKGRYRLFHQVGVELLGSNEIYHEVEILHLAKDLLEKVEIEDYVFQINSIGDSSSLKKISSAVKEFGTKHKQSIEKSDFEILEKNPLRFLDKAIHKYNFDNIPNTSDYISAYSLKRFKELKRILDDLGFPYKENNQLIRGIDYYNDFVFEATSSSLGSQDAILAGGRYDALVENLGGPPTKAIGFAAGIERMLLLIQERLKEIDSNTDSNEIDFYIAYQNSDFLEYSFKIANELRRNGFKVEIEYDNKSFVKQMKSANKLSSRYVAIIGEEEHKNSTVRIKNMSTGDEKLVDLDSEFIDVLIEEMSSSLS
tara:strand:- start:94317 stop:95621 length:1305 start_codon:yes stop_codon:yes gene_type:complete